MTTDRRPRRPPDRVAARAGGHGGRRRRRAGDAALRLSAGARRVALAARSGCSTAPRRDSRAGTLKAAALIGWFWGFGYFVAGLWWLGAAFLVEADQFAWALPLGVLGLPALLAFFPAFGFALARLFWTGDATPHPRLRGGADVERMAARPPVHGLSLEQPRHGAGPEHLADAGRLAGRPLRPDPARLAICAAPGRSAHRRDAARRRWTAPVAGAWRRSRCSPAFGAWRLPAEPGADVDERVAANHAAEPAAGRQVQSAQPRRHHAALSGDQPLCGTERPRRWTAATHLIWPESAFPFLLHRDAARAGADRRDPAARRAAHHGRGADGRAAAGRERRQVLQRDPDHRSIAARSSNPTTRFISCRSANTCRSFSIRLIRAAGPAAIHQHPGRFRAERESARRLSVPGLPPVAATICYEAIFPGRIPARRPAARISS